MPPVKKPRPRSTLKFEYVTSTVSVLKGDGIVVHVVNDSAVNTKTRVIIYQNTGAGAVVAVDTGDLAVTPTWQWGLGYTIANSGEYWVRIGVSSDSMIPKASFERMQSGIWIPVVSYRPGDFAIFQLPAKTRLW
jgi:hypothetical protein